MIDFTERDIYIDISLSLFSQVSQGKGERSGGLKYVNIQILRLNKQDVSNRVGLETSNVGVPH